MRGKGGLPTVPVVRERAMVDGGDRACEETQTRSSCSLIAHLQQHVDCKRLVEAGLLVQAGLHRRRKETGAAGCQWVVCCIAHQRVVDKLAVFDGDLRRYLKRQARPLPSK